MKLFDGVLVALAVLQGVWWFSRSATVLDEVQLHKPEMSFGEVVSLEVHRDENRLTLNRRESGDWVLSAFEDYPVRPRAVESLLARLAGFYPGPVVGTGAQDAQTYKVGEVRPYLRLRLRDAQGAVRSICLAPAQGNSDFVRVDGDERVFRLEPGLSRQLEANPRLWIDPLLYRLEQFPERIVFAMGGHEYSIGWDGKDFRCLNHILDKDKVVDFFKKMASLPIDEPLGMVDPFASQSPAPLMLFFDDPQTPIRLQLWYHVQPRTGVEGFRVRLNDDPREVFVLAHRLQDLFYMGLARFLPDDVVKRMMEQSGDK